MVSNFLLDFTKRRLYFRVVTSVGKFFFLCLNGYFSRKLAFISKMMKFNHSLPVQIRFNDTDPAQHVNNSVYQEYLDLGRLAYFRKVMGRTMVFNDLSLVIASIKIDFFKPVLLSDRIRVETRITTLGNKSLEMVQQVVRAGEEEPCAVGTTVLVCFDYRHQRSEVIPERWREKINRFEGAV
jgi:acyl-CoA thioester hydrolase